MQLNTYQLCALADLQGAIDEAERDSDGNITADSEFEITTRAIAAMSEFPGVNFRALSQPTIHKMQVLVPAAAQPADVISETVNAIGGV